MDFSTVERRRVLCAAEIEINRRLAPEIYLGVEEVRTPSGKSDWLVVMRRFDEDGLLDRMADRRALTPALMAALGERIARFHDGLAPIRDGFGRPDDYRHSIAADIRQMREQGERLDPALSEALAETMPSALEPHMDAGGPSRRGRRHPPLPRRSASAQHRAHRWQARAVRRHRVLRAHPQHRRALRPVVRPDGSLRARVPAARQPAAERMAVAHRRIAGRLARGGAGAAADVPVAARGDPRLRRRLDGRGERRRHHAARAPTSASRSASCSLRRRG